MQSLTQFLGIAYLSRPKLTPFDYLLLLHTYTQITDRQVADGLWDTLTPDNVVECLRLWLQEGRLKGPGTLKEAQQPESADSAPVFSGDEEPESRVGYPWDWKGRPEDFVVEDDNAATHLARNALGGKRREQFCTILGVPEPHTDDARDDITVQVLFFGDVETD